MSDPVSVTISGPFRNAKVYSPLPGIFHLRVDNRIIHLANVTLNSALGIARILTGISDVDRETAETVLAILESRNE